MNILKLILVLNLVYFQTRLNAQFNKGLLLDGCNNYLEVVNSSGLLMGENGMTIEAWIMPNCDDDNRMIVSKQWCNDQYGYYLSVFNGRLFWSISPDGFCTDNSNYQTSSVQIPAGVFTHIAIVHDAISIKLFVNGDLVPGQFRNGSFIPIYPSIENIRIGAYKNIGGSFGNFFSGIIDELRFYNAPLTAQQIKQNYNIPLSGNEANLVLYYDMEDVTGSGSNLTIENKCTAFSQNRAISKDFSGNRPIIVSNTDYISRELGLEDQIELCSSPSLVELNLDAFKAIKWSTGETTKAINIVKEGLYTVTVETELCRFLYDEVLVKKGNIEVFISQNLCANDSIYFDDQWIYDSGLYQQVLTSQGGCDSTITLDVRFQDTVRSMSQIPLCQGDSLLINGQWIYDEGSFNVLYTSINGCDSLASIYVDLIPQICIFDTVYLCQGDSVFINNRWYFGAQDVTYFEQNSFCPIKVTTSIKKLRSYRFLENIIICPNDSINYHGTWIDSSGMYLFSYKTQSGCDSMYVVEALEIESPSLPTSKPDCDNGFYELSIELDANWSYVWSNGSFANPAIFKNDSTASILYTHNDSDCLVRYNLDLPPIPIDDDVPFFRDSIVYPGKPLKYMVDLDNNFWSIDWYQDAKLSCEGCFAHTIYSQSVNEIELLFKHISGCQYHRKFLVKTDDSPDLYIPNIFAPSSKSGNEKWKIYVPECFMISMVKIYDRWGNLLYLIENSDEIEWDGYFHGKLVEQGVFTYIIHYTNPALVGKIKSGTLTMIW